VIRAPLAERGCYKKLFEMFFDKIQIRTKQGWSVKLICICILSAASATDYLIFSLKVIIDVYLTL